MPLRGWIFFDAACGICSESVRRWEKTLTRAGFELIRLQSSQAKQLLNLSPGELPEQMKLMTIKGQILEGVEALAYVSRFVWWAFPFHLLMKETFFRCLMVELYTMVARYRRRISQACGLRPFIPHS
ncbi:MAG: hypothetical protein KatS3mg104_3206 [Phycisphaerae bacterium]|jgi:predicted DCC family thiol-disulfide oxidoreductase YuxK|nr:MAG: hypothetical protein KatS3mg104_3206 [Phycisphaerae bacterium]